MKIGLHFSMLMVFALALVGCSDSESPTISGEADTQSAQQAPDQPAYRVLESFNVGEGVYVRSLGVDNFTNSIWVGTSTGVMQVSLATRELLQTITREDGLANEFVFAIFVDSKGNKWFGTDGGGMSRYKNGEWQTYFPMHGLADYWVYSFAEQKDGTIWVGTWAGLNSIDGKTGNFSLYLEELVNEWVYGLDVDSKDRVWIGTEGGVNMLDGDTWYTWTHENGLGAPNAQGLSVSANTGLGTRSRHDLSVLSMGSETYNPNYVFDMQVESDTSIWAGTWGGGAANFDGQKWTNYTTQDGLAGNIVYSIDKAPDGALWFGTNNGLSRFDGENWQSFNREHGLLDNNVYDVKVTNDSQVWAGTRNGVVLIGR